MQIINGNLSPPQRPHQDILSVFAAEKRTSHGFLRASAPMVRYSKLEFRNLLRQYGVQLAFTPMIIADSFNNSQKARDNEFTTCLQDVPVIAQFAARDAIEFATAAQLIYPYVDGVDCNCGCPQSWAISKGYGCGVLRKPEILSDIVQTTRRLMPTSFSISMKLRLLNGCDEESVRATIELARQLEKCGVTFLTLHGRTMWQRTSDPLNIPAMAEVKKSLQIPLIVNGNVRSWKDAVELHEQTQADGIMAARGLLSNPTIFDPTYEDNSVTPTECLREWLNIASRAGDKMNFQCFHHHSTFMWNKQMKRKLRLEFNNMTCKEEVFNFFEDRFGVTPTMDTFSPFQYTECTYLQGNTEASSAHKISETTEESWNQNTNGKYFIEFNGKSLKQKALSNRDEFELEGSFFTDI